MAQAPEKVAKTGGDDLDDGLELDPELLASSDNEDNSDAEFEDDADIGEEETRAAVDEDSEDDDVEGGAEAGEKRKREGDGDEDAAAEKRRRKREKFKERKAKRLENMPESDTKPLLSTPATHLSQSQLRTLLLTSIRETFPRATPMEIDDMLLPESMLLGAPQFAAPKIDDPEAIAAAGKKRIEGLVKSSKNSGNGTPRVIVLCLSGLRCADVVRDLRSIKGKGEVAKLFAKHMKVPEQVNYLHVTKVSIAVGTPARIAKLISEDALILTKETMILLDIGHRDSKTRTLLTMPEARTEMWKSLFTGDIRKRIMDVGAHVGAV